MATTIQIFLDTSAIFAGIWSARGGGRVLLRLGEAGAVSLLTSGLALKELENALRAQAPGSLGALALLLDRAGFSIAESPSQEHLAAARSLVDHPADASILAAALSQEPDFFVTLDQTHFLGNPQLPNVVPFQIGTPGECVDWIRRRFRRLASGNLGPG